MCGTAGFVHLDPSRRADSATLRAMTDSIRHRGPGDDGAYVEGHVALSMRRLSIIDLITGHQPIANEDETIWIVFNGEVYNYLELRDELAARGHRFRTRSDTEVLVHLYEEEGGPLPRPHQRHGVARTSVLDEPLGDASILPTYLLSRFPREQVTVALGGEGGTSCWKATRPTSKIEICGVR